MTGLMPLESDITIGEHKTVTWHGMTFNVDTILSTIVAGVIVLLLGFWVVRSMAKDTGDHVPTKIQILWETIVGQVNKQVEDNLGKVHPFVAPLAIALFFFILIANWLELIPTEFSHGNHVLSAPTADTNLTYALATVTMVSVWTYGIRQKGTRGYFKHFTEPFPILLPLNILEELIKPITLALRLFGNIFAGGIMLALIGLIPIYAFWAPNLLWKAFDMVIGAIQAFIFALLTVLYFAMAGAGHEEHERHEEFLEEERRKKAETAHADEAEPVPAH
ncbi:F0F1 ATP synthase subunit A [Nocardioides sp.]|uniref:F0F1 ATP synthase subunit A n=1 Tax=Nocardioides sp. TaxID=35761 RepID=UPI003784875D